MARRLYVLLFSTFALLAACTSSSTGAGDGAACVDVDAAAYDRSCAADSDCEIVPTGHLCTGSCGCGGEPIAKRAFAKYQSATSSVKLEACPCASPGTPRCVQSTCTSCTFGPGSAAGCPDAG